MPGIKEPREGEFVPFKGFHPFYLEMTLMDLLELLPSWQVSKVYQDENDIDDEFLILTARKDKLEFILSLDKTRAHDENKLQIHSIETLASNSGTQVHLNTAQNFAESYDFSVRRDIVAENDDEGCDPYLIYFESDGNPSLSLLEVEGRLKSITLTRDFDFEVGR